MGLLLYKKVFALDIKDITDYLGKDSFGEYYDIIYGTNGVSKTFWLRSTSLDQEKEAYLFDLEISRIHPADISTFEEICQPAFVIDLSDIEYTIINAYRRYTSLNTYVDDPAKGSVMESNEIEPGITFTLRAYPKSGYHFDKWLLNGVDIGGTREQQITIGNDPAYYTAIFAPNSAPESLPEKGDIITLPDGDNYRVLNVDGLEVLVLAMNSISSAEYSIFDNSLYYENHSVIKYNHSLLEYFL